MIDENNPVFIKYFNPIACVWVSLTRLSADRGSKLNDKA